MSGENVTSVYSCGHIDITITSILSASIDLSGEDENEEPVAGSAGSEQTEPSPPPQEKKPKKKVIVSIQPCSCPCCQAGEDELRASIENYGYTTDDDLGRSLNLTDSLEKALELESHYYASPQGRDVDKASTSGGKGGRSGSSYNVILRKGIAQKEKVKCALYRQSLVRYDSVKDNVERRKQNRRKCGATSSSTWERSGDRANAGGNNDDYGAIENALLQEYILPATAQYNQRFLENLGITGNTLQILQDIQNRDITPEDYELLLLLDNSIKPKTLENSEVRVFPTLTVGVDFDLSDDLGNCAVCLELFGENDILRRLPCGHLFHVDCIDAWLTTSSINCPQDNLPVKG